MSKTNNKDINLKRIILMLKEDFKYHNVKANVELTEITPDILEAIIQCQSRNNRMFYINFPLVYKSVERILNGDLEPYYEMTAFIYGTILKMEASI